MNEISKLKEQLKAAYQNRNRSEWHIHAEKFNQRVGKLVVPEELPNSWPNALDIISNGGGTDPGKQRWDDQQRKPCE